MSSRFQRIGLPRRLSSSSSWVGPAFVALAACLARRAAVATTPPPATRLFGWPRSLSTAARGHWSEAPNRPLTAVARDTGGKVTTVNTFAWRSTVDSIVTMGPDGRSWPGIPACRGGHRVGARNISAGIGGARGWQGPAKVAAFQFNPPVAVTPGGEPGRLDPRRRDQYRWESRRWRRFVSP